MTNILNIKKDSCTGCGACMNICPNNAITLKENEEGFLYPVINQEKCTNCNLCLNICPVNAPKYDNKIQTECYAYMASDEERLKSSSGAVFPILSKHFIANGDFVAGAIWDKDWSVKHIVSNKAEDIEKMRSSKYIQSRIENTYTEIKTILRNGKKVLFTGTPCQVAGLKNYLQKDYQNLFCIDIICHGVPSYKVLKKYLNENYNINDIKQIDFRDKKTSGWGNILKIDFNTRDTKVSRWNYDSFYSLFSHCVLSRKSCGECQFNKLPRQGDLTMADFWSVDNRFHDKKGTSLVISNNNKGDFLLDILSKNAKLMEKQPIESALKGNPNLIESPILHKDRDKFFKKMNEKSINDLKRYYLDDYCDCMILNFWSALNYGAILTCFGVQCLLEKLGYSAKVINYVSYPQELDCDYEKSFTNKFATKYLNLTKPIKTYNDLFSLNQKANNFIVGSDQVWRKSCIDELVNDEIPWSIYFLDFVRSCNKKISYSASIGIDNIEGSILEQEKMYYYLAQFDEISVREDLAQLLLKRKLKLDSEVVLDGVFHISKDLLNEMTAPYKSDEEYIGCFVLPYFKNAVWYQEKLQLLSKKMGLPVKSLEFDFETSVEEWLAFIKNAKFLVSDSYHAIVFSIIFNVPFVQIKNAKAQSRFESLFNILNIKNKTVSEFNKEIFESTVNTEVNWEHVNRIIEMEKKKAEDWTLKVLKAEKTNKYVNPHFLEAELLALKKQLMDKSL